MASTKFYLDSRNIKPGKECPLKVAIFTAKQTAFINLGLKLLPTQWDNDGKRVVKHPQKEALNVLIGQRMQEINMLIYEYTSGNRLDMTAKELKQKLEAHFAEKAGEKAKVKKEVPKNIFIPYMEKFMERYKGRTLDLYKCTYRKVMAFIGEKQAKSLTFEDMDKSWLYAFDEFLAQTAPSQNARNIHLRNLRTVFNDARDEEVILCYPFRKFKIKPMRTKKRSFKVEVLRKILRTPLMGHEEKYRDYFMLIFGLCGINVIDLCHLKKVEDGRVDFDRAKTKRHYSIKVEPEVQALIDKYKGVNWLVTPLDTNKNYRGFYMHLCKGLRAVKERLNGINDGLEIDALTSYWARHTWATIAASLDIPKDTIAAALGHGGYTVTDIYIDFDQRKVDEANRKVLDWVYYNIDPNAPKKRGRPKKIQ